MSPSTKKRGSLGAVWRGSGDVLGADIGAASGAVVDDDRLTQALPKVFRYQSAHEVRAAYVRKRNNQLDRAIRPGLGY